MTCYNVASLQRFLVREAQIQLADCDGSSEQHSSELSALRDRSIPLPKAIPPSFADRSEHLLAFGAVLSDLLVQAGDLRGLGAGAAAAAELAQPGGQLVAHAPLAHHDGKEDEEALQHVDDVEHDPATGRATGPSMVTGTDI